MRLSITVVVFVLLLSESACTGQSVAPPVPAPNIASPAPTPVARGMNGECFIGMLRAERVEPAKVANILGSRVPTWLPGGFGLLAAWNSGDEGGSHGAVWTDETCREVMLEIWSGEAGNESPMPDGRWIVADEGTCTEGFVRDVPCLTYHAQTSGDALSLLLVDLARQEASRVVAGIRL